jgi:hypothetical protein
MPNRERIDPLEAKLFRLFKVEAAKEQAMVARIIEEGAVPRDLMRPPGKEAACAVLAIMVRAFRPPFKLQDGLLGRAEYWTIEG